MGEYNNIKLVVYYNARNISGRHDDNKNNIMDPDLRSGWTYSRHLGGMGVRWEDAVAGEPSLRGLTCHPRNITCCGVKPKPFCFYFDVSVSVAGWRHAHRSEWPFISIITTHHLLTPLLLCGRVRSGPQGYPLGPAIRGH